MSGDQLSRDAQEVRLRLVRVGDDAAAHICRGTRWLRQPRRQQPGRAGFAQPDRPAAEQFGELLVDRRPVLGEDEPAVGLAESLEQRLVELLVGLVAADVDDDLRSPQAGGYLEGREVDVLLDLAQRLGERGLGDAEHPDRGLDERLGAIQDRGHRRRGERLLPHRLQLPGRAGQHDHDDVARRHDQAGRGSGRIDRDRALRDHRLLAIGVAQGLGVELHPFCEALEDRVDPRLHLLVEHQLTAGEPGDDLTGQVVRGRPEAAAGHDQVHTLGLEEAKGRLEILRAVADDRDLGDLHPALSKALGDPGPVSVGDPAGQDLSPGDEYSRPD